MRTNKLVARWRTEDLWVNRKPEILDWFFGSELGSETMKGYDCRFDGKLDLRGFQFDEYKTRGVVVHNKVFRNIDFSYAGFDHLFFKSCRFSDCLFKYTHMLSTSDERCEFNNCVFFKTRINGWLGLGESLYKDILFDSANFKWTHMLWPDFENCEFRNCQFGNTDFGGSHFENVKFTGKVEDVWFRGIYEATKDNRYRESAYERWNTIKPMKVDFSDARLSYIDISDYCDLSEVILPGDGSCYLITDVKAMRKCIEDYASAFDGEEAVLFQKSLCEMNPYLKKVCVEAALLKTILEINISKRKGEKMGIFIPGDLLSNLDDVLIGEKLEEAIVILEKICRGLLEKGILKEQHGKKEETCHS